MADEYDYYGRKKNRGLTGVYGDEYEENLNNAGNDFQIPDYTGAANRRAPDVPNAGRTNTFSRQMGTGMKAVGDTNEAIANPDNAPSTRLFQAGNHQAVSSSIQDEHDPANAASTRLFQGANHDVAGKTVEGQYSLDNQPTSPFFRAIRGNGKPVSGLKAVEETDKAVGNLDYDEQNPQKAHPYAFGFYNGFANSVVNQMKAEHMGTEFEKASDRPDQYAGTSPLKAARTGFRELGALNEEINKPYEQNRFHYNEPTVESIHQATEKYSNVLGGVAGASLLMAVKRNLPQTGMTLTANNWSRLTHEVYQRVLDKTGDEEFAQAMGWGAMATLASDLEPWGMFSKKLPADYQTIADPVARVIDSLVSDHLADKVVDEGVDRIVKNKQQQNKLE